MAPLDENPNCLSTHASFRLVGDRLATAEVIRLTGVAPSFAADKGSVRPPKGSRGRAITQGTGVWSLGSKGSLDSTSVERHLLWLLDRLEPTRDALLAAAAKYAASADFFCYWLSATGHGGPEVSAPTLERIASFNASLGFDYYGPYDDSVGVSS